MPTPGGLHDTHTSVTMSFAITSLEMNVIMQKKAGSEGRNFAAPQIGFYVDLSTASTAKVLPTSNVSGCDMMCDWSGILQPLPPKSIPCEGTSCKINDFQVKYDRLIVTVGAQTNMFGIP